MKWVPAKFGAEPKKMAILGGLALVLVYLVWSNLFSGGSSSQPPPSPQARALTPYAGVAPEPPSSAASAAPPRRQVANTTAARAATLEDFKPSMKRARLAASDPTQVDPTLRLDLLTRLQSAKFEGDMRSLFEFSQAPPPLAIREPAHINVGRASPFGPPPVTPPGSSSANTPPPAPPIPLKFYGFVNPARPDVKSAFFLDGEDILVAGEGETIHNRYRIVRIGVNSAVVEDTKYKNQQTLPLVAEEQG
ncbi:MAG: hypothetical protein ABSF98_13790 [Bryobacteraceae bacterium]|jgi:hypothetical protein